MHVHSNGPMHSLILTFTEKKQVSDQKYLQTLFTTKIDIIINKQIMYKWVLLGHCSVQTSKNPVSFSCIFYSYSWNCWLTFLIIKNVEKIFKKPLKSVFLFWNKKRKKRYMSTYQPVQVFKNADNSFSISKSRVEFIITVFRRSCGIYRIEPTQSTHH